MWTEGTRLVKQGERETRQRGEGIDWERKKKARLERESEKVEKGGIEHNVSGE